MAMERAGWRRWAAVAVLLACVGLAWWTWRERATEVRVVWLLTHAETALDGVLLDKSRLVRFHWRVPVPQRAVETARWQELPFAVGNAPDATRLFVFYLPAGVQEVEVGCHFALGPGAEPIRTRGKVRIAASDGEQVIDIDRCGDRVR